MRKYNDLLNVKENNENKEGVIEMTNQERVEKLQSLKVRLVILKKSIEKVRGLNRKLDKVKYLHQEIVTIAREVDKVIGIQGQVENKVIEGLKRYTIQNKMGINNQINCILATIEDVIQIFNK